MPDPLTIDLIIDKVRAARDGRKSFTDKEWLDISQDIALTLLDVGERIADLKNEVVKIKLMARDRQLSEKQKINMAEATMEAEASAQFLELQKLLSKKEQAIELIRLAKSHARLASEGHL